LRGIDVTNASPNAMIDVSTETAYQVPTGKTFTAVSILWGSYGVFGTTKIYQGDTVDAITLIKYKFQHIGENSNEYPVKFTFASEKFITYDPVTANTLTMIQIVGYEE